MLEARELSLTIDGNAILQNLSCCFAPKQITVLTGPNGSGKTMLLEILAGLREADEGSVLLNAEPYPHKGQALGTGVGIVFQQPEMQIIEQTVEEDILFGLKNMNLGAARQKELLDSTLAWSGLSRHRHQYPQTLSGGELRRLALAGVIAMCPQYILLDEPFENLDYPGVREVIHQILDLREKGHGIVLVTHDLEKCLAHSDRLAVLRSGKMVANTPIAPNAPAEELRTLLEENDVRLPPMAIKDMTWY